MVARVPLFEAVRVSSPAFFLLYEERWRFYCSMNFLRPCVDVEAGVPQEANYRLSHRKTDLASGTHRPSRGLPGSPSSAPLRSEGELLLNPFAGFALTPGRVSHHVLAFIAKRNHYVLVGFRIGVEAA